MRFLVLALLMNSVAVWAVNPEKAQAKPPELTPQLLEKGKTIYTLNCASCHGDKGDGNGATGKYLVPKPTDFVKGPYKQGDKLIDIYASVTNGVRTNPAMRSFKDLSEEQRWAVAFYVQSFRKGSAKKK